MASKTQKKIDQQVRLALTEACEQFLDDIPGFAWLTHQADYSRFPASLLITCVFDSLEQQQRAIDLGHTDTMHQQIQAQLLRVGVKLPRRQQVVFDNEQACQRDHAGNWAKRLATH